MIQIPLRIKNNMKKIPQTWVTPIRFIYTYCFHVYAWYWLYKIFFVLPFDWENLANWCFACIGIWFFVLDSGDLKFKKTMNKSSTYPEMFED